MNKSLLEELKEASVSNEEAYVEFFNNGEVRRIKRSADKRMNQEEQDATLRRMNYVFVDGAESYALNCPYNKISMGLEVGLIYNNADVGNENIIKEGTKPIDNLVHCYSGNITSYLDGEQTNEREYYHYSVQGFVKYDKLVSTMEKNGLSFNGPKTFEEFKEKILSGSVFDISLDADLKEKEKVEVKEEPKKLVKKHFFWKKDKN